MRREALSAGYVGKDTIEALEKINIAIGKNENGRIAYVKNDKLLKADGANDIP